MNFLAWYHNPHGINPSYPDFIKDVSSREEAIEKAIEAQRPWHRLNGVSLQTAEEYLRLNAFTYKKKI